MFSDASALRNFAIDAYGRVKQKVSLGIVGNCLLRNFDAFGHSEECHLMPGIYTNQHSHLDYDSKSVMIGMNLEGLKSFFLLEV